ncbi:hypothetical protein HPB51_003718 [Rhipicephalus microplus]|uniref:THAP-type domain-containing protein n=1 Tax=Rhipicephalus microplus TaxID=6941 RepID=A0A9J6E638_RHIMP|nr:hypothetical protein HPB51_003718 [Rhipicephalus microplus]
MRWPWPYLPILPSSRARLHRRPITEQLFGLTPFRFRFAHTKFVKRGITKKYVLDSVMSMAASPTTRFTSSSEQSSRVRRCDQQRRRARGRKLQLYLQRPCASRRAAYATRRTPHRAGQHRGYDSAKSAAEKRHFFKPPNETSRLQEWQHAIPRSDRELTSSCVVCDLHFQEADLVKNFVHNIRGDVVVIPRDKWSLKDDAVPRLFPNCPKYLSKPLRKRKAPAVRSPLQPKRRNVQDDAEQEDTAPNTFDYGERDGSVSGSVTLDRTQSLFEELSTMAQEGRRLQGWSTELVDSVVVLYKLEVENSVPRVGKAVTLSSDFCLSVSANGRLVPSTVYTGCSHLEVKSLNDLTCLLSYVEKLKPCQGFPAKLYPQISSSSVASKEGETWRRKTCTTLSLDATCTECKTLGRLFLMCTKNSKVRKPRPKSKCMKKLRRKVIRATLKRERLSKELASMKKQLCNVIDAKIESVLHVLPAKQQLAFKTAVMAAKAKMKNGRRYDDEWLMTCLLLHISSPKAYTLI